MPRPSVLAPCCLAALAILITANLTLAQTVSTSAGKGNPQGEGTHRATLSWKPSPDAEKPGVKLQYWVFRSNGSQRRNKTPECAGKFEKIAEVDGTTATYTDSTVKAGHVYCYYAKSVIGNRVGPRSEIVIAVIPPDQ